MGKDIYSNGEGIPSQIVMEHLTRELQDADKLIVSSAQRHTNLAAGGRELRMYTEDQATEERRSPS